MVNASKRQAYKVIKSFQNPNHHGWFAVGDTVELLPQEAEFLVLNGKVEKVTGKPKKEKNNA